MGEIEKLRMVETHRYGPTASTLSMRYRTPPQVHGTAVLYTSLLYLHKESAQLDARSVLDRPQLEAPHTRSERP